MDEAESTLSNEFLKKGYIIRPVANLEAYQWIQAEIQRLVKEIIKELNAFDLNLIHERISGPKLNNFRMQVIEGMNNLTLLREKYFLLAKPYLEVLVGNELAMQLRVNLSIQLPTDSSSLLPVHSDTWSGDSPYEVVVWLPLVDCYKTKAMYILPADRYLNMISNNSLVGATTSDELFHRMDKEVEWLSVKAGEVLIFNQSLPHGNRINEEVETRWSMNCRFKGVFTPYGDKKIGEFFEPITLRAASKIGIEYEYPEL